MTLVAKNIIVRLIDGSTLFGQVNLIIGGEIMDRVSDLVHNKASDFITLFNVKDSSTMILNKRHIVWIAPDEGQSLSEQS